MVADEIATKSGTHYVKCGFQKIALSLEEDYAILPEIAVQEHAKKNASCGLSPGWSMTYLVLFIE